MAALRYHGVSVVAVTMGGIMVFQWLVSQWRERLLLAGKPLFGPRTKDDFGISIGILR
jgi:hypothetical protein